MRNLEIWESVIGHNVAICDDVTYFAAGVVSPRLVGYLILFLPAKACLINQYQFVQLFG